MTSLVERMMRNVMAAKVEEGAAEKGADVHVDGV